jgi:hypothetical protein
MGKPQVGLIKESPVTAATTKIGIVSLDGRSVWFRLGTTTIQLSPERNIFVNAIVFTIGYFLSSHQSIDKDVGQSTRAVRLTTRKSPCQEVAQ